MIRKLLETHLVQSWAWILLRGLLAIAFGLLCLLAPGVSLLALVFFWGGFALLDGAISLGAGVHTNAWPMTAIGVAGFVAGLLIFLVPLITGTTLLGLIAGWAVIAGGFEVAGALKFRREVANEWPLIVAGVLSIGFGLVLFLRSDAEAGALAFVGLIAGFFLVSGMLQLVHALRLRGLDHHGHAMPRPV